MVEEVIIERDISRAGDMRKSGVSGEGKNGERVIGPKEGGKEGGS